MARLPTKDELSRGAYRSAPMPTVADQTGAARGLAGLGAAVADIGDDIVKQRGVSQIAGAEADYTGKMLELERNIDNSTDYGSYGKTFEAGAGSILESAAKRIADPAMRQRLIEEKKIDIARRQQGVLSAADRKQRVLDRVNLGSAIEAEQNIFTDLAKPEQERMAALGRIRANITAAERTGLLDPALAEKWRKTYDDGSVLKEAELRVLNDQTFRREVLRGDVGELAAKDLPAEASAILNTIGNTEAKSYNILNGGEEFSDLSDHPRRTGAGGTSTAAGRYQFVKGTWDRAKAATGVQDFSPESQDRAAWWLAQSDYKANTGRDLLSDIRAGEYSLIKKGLGSTWEGINKLSDSDFASRMEKGGGPAGVLRSGVYASLSPEQRQNLLEVAQRKQREVAVEQRGEIANAVDNAPTAFANTGQYTGRLPTEEQFNIAYGEEGSRRYAEFQSAIETGRQMYDMRTMSAADIQKMVQDATPTSSGDDAVIEDKRYQTLSAAAAQTIKAREADPAAYVQSAFPAVAQAWEQAAADGDLAPAIRMSAAAQTQLGIPPQSQAFIPKSQLETFIETAKDATRPLDERMSAIVAPVLSTQDGAQRRAIFDQLVKADSSLAKFDGVVRAYSRGDFAAAKRLFQAGSTNFSEMKTGSISGYKDDEIKAAWSNAVLGEGAIGDATYGFSLNIAGREENARRDGELVMSAVKYQMLGNGGDMGKAIEQVKRDLYGDVQVVSRGDVYLTAPPSLNPQDITATLAEKRGDLRDAILSAVREDVPLETLPAEQRGPYKLSREMELRQAEETLRSGVWADNGDGSWSFYDKRTGMPIAGDAGIIRVTPDEVKPAPVTPKRTNTPRASSGDDWQVLTAPPRPAGRGNMYPRQQPASAAPAKAIRGGTVAPASNEDAPE